MTFGRYPDPKPRSQKLRERSRRNYRMASTVKPREAVVGGATAAAVPKVLPYRDDTLLQMAKGRPCLLLIPAVCNHRIDTTVAAHENQHKGMARKASDERSAWACFACHVWFDQGAAERIVKREAFVEAHARQVLAWRAIAADANEPVRFRNAALRALARLEEV